MNFFSYLIIFFLSTSIAIADQLIIEPDMGRAPILNAIDNSKKSLKLVMYNFTDKTLLDALINQQKNGKAVEIILEKKPYKTIHLNKKTMALLKRHGINWQGTGPGFRLTHQKSLIIDDKQAIIMSFNFTHSSFDKQRNFALITDKPALINEIREHFNADWQHKTASNHSPDLFWSPKDSRKKLISLIHTAKNEIDIYAQSISDKKIMGALMTTAKHGVKINLLTSAKLDDKNLILLRNAGINIHRSKRLYIHAKVFMIDNQKALVGSINLTRASLDDNRELSIITHDPLVLKQLIQQFWKDWD